MYVRTSSWFAFAYDHSSKIYKILCGFNDTRTSNKYAMNTVGSDSWKEIKVTCDVRTTLLWPISTSDGALHWMARCNTNKESESKCHIISMEGGSEEFRIIRDPPNIRIRSNSGLFELGGSLALLDRFSCVEWDVWVLEDCYEEVWVKKYCINIPDCL